MTTIAPASPLLAEHRALDAQLIDFAGWQMPLKYGSELTEHHAVRSTAGLFDLSHMGEIEVDGIDAAEMLDYALAGKLSALAEGRAKYSLLCNAEGGVIDDLVVYRLDDERYLVVANAANVSEVHRELTMRGIEFDVVVHDRSNDTSLVAIQGPKSQDILTRLLAQGRARIVEGLKYYAAVRTVVAGVDALVARTGYTGEDGFELYIRNADAVHLWRALLDATTSHGGLPAGLACRDSLRLEAGMALYGNELTLDTNPYEAGLGRVVQLGKGFVGRAALARIAETPVTRRLVGLAGDGRRAARAGYTVHAATDHGPIGSVTSGALSPTLGYPIALAYVDVALAALGTELVVDIRGTQQPFTVVPTPFYRRSN